MHQIPDTISWSSIAELLKDGSNRAFYTDRAWKEDFEFNSEGKAKFAVLKEVVITDHWGFQFERSNFLVNAFDRKITQLLESGLADLYVKNADRKFKSIKEDEEHVPLSMKHLAVWFYMLTILLTVSFVIFIVESHKTLGNDSIEPKKSSKNAAKKFKINKNPRRKFKKHELRIKIFKFKYQKLHRKRLAKRKKLKKKFKKRLKRRIKQQHDIRVYEL